MTDIETRIKALHQRCKEERREPSAFEIGSLFIKWERSSELSVPASPGRLGIFCEPGIVIDAKVKIPLKEAA